jgi:CrcB protein
MTVWPPAGAGFPWAIFAANLIGSAFLGALTALVRRRPHHRALASDLLGVGFCGGLTTMSTFAVDVAAFARNDRVAMAVTYLVASTATAIGAAWLGATTERWISEVEQA